VKFLDLDADFFDELRASAAAMTANPADVMLILYGESGLNPASPGHVAFYEGLNQIQAPYLKARGVDQADYLTWPASRQMREIVGPFLTAQVRQLLGKPVRSAGVLEALNLYPASVKKHGDAPDSIVIDGNSSDPGERLAYVKNQALDRNHDGAITISDLDEWLGGLSKQKPFQQALAQLGGDISPAGGGRRATSPWAILGGLTVIAAAVVVARRIK